ncbi:MAG: cupin domain-containing protein, partial [Sphingobacteriales bacterium]
MQAYFEDVSKVLDKVTANRKQAFKMNLNTMLYMGVLMNKYRNDIIAKNPPDFAIRVLGFIARLFGYKY